jgi:hypothetical protein
MRLLRICYPGKPAGASGLLASVTAYGGFSKWSVLTDEDLSNTMPDVFEPPPEIIAGFMAYEAEHALRRWNPLMWGIVKMRGLLVAGPVETMHARQQDKSPATWMRRLITFLRAAVFDYFGRRR